MILYLPSTPEPDGPTGFNTLVAHKLEKPVNRNGTKDSTRTLEASGNKRRSLAIPHGRPLADLNARRKVRQG
jgi:hypothetical protein